MKKSLYDISWNIPEGFKLIPDLESYIINNEGVIMSIPKIREGNLKCLNNHEDATEFSKRFYKSKVIKPHFKQRYWYVCLMHKGVKKSYRVHRLVYKTFIGNIPSDKVIDHIDGNTSNNNISNLRCVTQKENSNNPNTICKHFKAVIMKDKNNIALKEFNSSIEAMIYLGYTYKAALSSHIGDVCNNKRNSAYGYKWEWKKESL